MNLAQFARVFLLCFMPSCAALLAAGGGGLRLVCDVEGRALEVAKVVNGQIMLAGGGGEIAAPRDAKWRLEGGLRENAALLDVSPTYGIHRHIRRNEEPLDCLPMRVNCGVSHLLIRRNPDVPVESRFLYSWPGGTPTEALVVMAWLTGGKAARVEARAIPQTAHNEFATSVLWEMNEREAMGGRAVMLLWCDGKFIAPAPWAGEGSAQQAAVAAVLFDDDAALRGLIAGGLDVAKAKHKRGMTLLHLAAEAGSDRALDALVRAAPRLVRMEADGLDGSKNITALHWAAANGRLAAVRRLIATKADVNAKVTHRNPEFWDTAVFRAARSGHVDVVAALLQAGAKTWGKRRDGHTVLDNAILNGDCEMADLVLKERRGDQKLLKETECGDPLRIQLRMRRAPMIEWLLRHGIKIRREDVIGEAPVRKGISVMEWDRGGSSIRRYAPDERTGTYMEAEEWGVWRGILESVARPNDGELAKILFGACGDIMEPDGGEPDPTTKTKVRRTQVRLLLEAARAGYVHVIRELLDAGMTVGERDTGGHTSLHYASGADQLDAVLLLLERGAVMNMPNNAGMTPLEWALQHGSARVAREFARRGAKINLRLRQAEDVLADAIRLDIPELVLAARASGFPSSGKLFGAWTLEQAARFFEAGECLKALESMPREKPAESSDETRIAKPAELGAPVRIVETGRITDPRNLYSSRPEVTVAVTALVEPTGGVRLCTVKDANVPRDMRAAAISAVRTSQMSMPKVDGGCAGAMVQIPVMFEEGKDDTEPRTSAQMGVPPQIEHQPAPLYPFSASRNGEEGLVWLWLIVTENGSVENVDVVRATSRAFAGAASRAVKGWRFIPGTIDGKPVRMTIGVPIVFKQR